MTLATHDYKQPPAVRLGDRARIARREMKLNQAQFVEALREYLPDVEAKAYSSWEAGTTPSNADDVAVALEALTGYSWTWFLRGIQNPPTPTPPRGGSIDPRVSPLSDSNRRPSLYIVDDAWPAEAEKRKVA